MDLTVILVNWNTREMLRDCLRTVFAGEGALALQVIVVDNGSTDCSCQMLARDFPQVEVISNPGTGALRRPTTRGCAARGGGMCCF